MPRALASTSLIAVAAAVTGAPSVDPATVPAVLLHNAAKPGTTMPATGLGT
eukprot:gene9945-biopygen7235